MTGDQSIKHCATCGCEVTVYSTCDREETGKVWCFDCFDETPCGKGWHGEGCTTNVFEDGQSPRHDVHWRCFHCGDTFTRAQERWAREHFGATSAETPVCLMRVPGEGSLLTALRNAQDELSQRREDDSDLMRALMAQSADHGEAVRQAEDAGYAKALRDIEAGKVEPDHAARIMAALGKSAGKEPA